MNDDDDEAAEKAADEESIDYTIEKQREMSQEGLISCISFPDAKEFDIAVDVHGILTILLKQPTGELLPFKLELYRRTQDAHVEKIWRHGELIWEYGKGDARS